VRAGLAGGKEGIAIAALMSSAWANLAKQGTPSKQWGAYDNTTDASFHFGASVADSGMQPNKRKQCDFLRWCRGDKAGHNPLWGVQLCTPMTPTPPK
jgi:carboxylesterase type B